MASNEEKLTKFLKNLSKGSENNTLRNIFKIPHKDVGLNLTSYNTPVESG